MSEAPLLEVRDLETSFFTGDGVVKAVDCVSLRLGRGETLGLVGESGCGKSVTSLSVLRLIPDPPGRITGGRILFDGRDLLSASAEEMRKIRGNQISMIFQEPMTSLNPVYTVGFQVAESLRLHQGMDKARARARAVDMLHLVGIPMPERRVDDYPHQMSGGMRQRVMIAMALACEPRLLIADEPTTALDVTIQAQILELMKELKERLGMSILFITHDLGVVAEMAQRVAVMYAGQVVEEADVRSLFKEPLHPYTQGLLASIPGLEAAAGPLYAIEGTVPSLLDLPPGCRFADRCPKVMEICRTKPPALTRLQPAVSTGLQPAAAGESGRSVRCWLQAKGGAAS
ncbi:MAG TPA: ABC transporter ATP-binding protein [Bacillota bacterium]|jgi:oligopeptide/dipeptide ABC transporter ATP-binding protein